MIAMNNKIIGLALCLCLLLIAVGCSSKGKIRILNEKNLEQFAKDNSYWLVQISSGKCAECAQHGAELEQLAFMFEGILKVGKIDAKLIPSLKIEANPTYMFTRSDQA